jgi:hypothetical protein
MTSVRTILLASHHFLWHVQTTIRRIFFFVQLKSLVHIIHMKIGMSLHIYECYWHPIHSSGRHHKSKYILTCDLDVFFYICRIVLSWCKHTYSEEGPFRHVQNPFSSTRQTMGPRQLTFWTHHDCDGEASVPRGRATAIGPRPDQLVAWGPASSVVALNDPMLQAVWKYCNYSHL